MDITDIGNYWDQNGEDGIDLIAINRFNKRALIAEVKRNQKKISITKLERKSEVRHKELVNYQITFNGFSWEKM